MNTNEFESVVGGTDKIVVVDFMAEWCGPCRALGPVLDSLVKTRPDVELVKVDIDESAELAERFQVRSVPTLVLMKDGQEVGRTVGLTPKTKLEELIDRYK